MWTMEILAVLLLTVSAAILFATEAFRVDVVAIIILVALALSGLVTTGEALSGFSNSATATVATMFILSAALRRTGVIDAVTAALEGLIGRRPGLLYVSLLLAAGAVSAFINNTAAVAVMIPIVLGVCRGGSKGPGRYLMPLSFAAQVGGVCTLIGTSTNILVSDIASRAGQRPFSMFEFSGLGLCFAAAAFVYLITAAPLMLGKTGARAREPLARRYELHDYLAELQLDETSPLVGRRLAEAGLERVLDLQVLEILRHGRRLWMPDADETIAAGDVLLVRGPIRDLLKARSVTGLRLRREAAAEDTSLEGGGVALVEALVPPGSPLDGVSLRAADFRRRHRVQALAIRHHDRLARTNVGKVRLSVGDVLLLQGRRDDIDAMRRGNEVLLMEEVEPHVRSWRRALFVLGVMAAVVGAAASGLTSILLAAIAGCALLVLLGVLSVDEVYAAIDWKVIFLLAGVIPLGTALESTGAATLLAGGLTTGLGSLGPWLVLSALYLITSLLTALMSNNATAALLAPVGLAIAAQLAVSPRPFLVAITFGASMSFMTPVGYQTNAMVHGPGGYRFIDFMRVGAPLNLLFWLIATLLIPRFFPF